MNTESQAQFTPFSNVPLLPARTLTRPIVYLYAPMNRPAGYATAPEGFAVVSNEQTDFTPYGTISYPRMLTARECYKWELKSLFDDFKVGDQVEWCEHGGEVFESAIFQIDDSWAIWADEYTKLPFWRLHRVASQSNAASIDELPAKMPMPALMDADTAPVSEAEDKILSRLETQGSPIPVYKTDAAFGDVIALEAKGLVTLDMKEGGAWVSLPDVAPAPTAPAIGDSVRYTYNTDNTVKQVFSGEIVDIKHSTVLNSIMYRVQPDADERLAYLGAVWIMPYQLEGQAHLDPVCDQLATLRKIEAAYLKWEAAYLAGRFEEAARLDMIHRKLEDEHRERLYGPRRPCPKNAPQSPQNGPNGDIEAIQAWMKVMGTETPPIAPANEETLNLEGLTWWQRDEARAAYWSKKSVAQIREGYTPLPDAETLKVKRDAQYAEAKARVDANVKRVMGGGA